MPRNPQGLYTLPLPPVVPGELIEANWANPTLDDIASALTGSLPRNGTAPMLAPLTLSNIPPTQPRHAVDVGYVQQFLAYATGMPVGAVIPLAGASIPNGFLLCDGRAVSRTDYTVLFAVIGTIYGSGDGSTTFNLPDMRDWFIRGKSDARQVGSTQTAAFAAHVHGVSDPGHSHTQTAHDHTITTGSHSHGVNDPGHSHSQGFEVNAGQYGVSAAILNTPWVHQTGVSGTGISIQAAGNLGGSTDSKQPGISSSQTGVSIGAAGGDETRPQNVAMNYVIKAVNDPGSTVALTGITSSDTNVLSINNANPAVPELVVHSNVPFGAAKLGSDGKIPLSILPPTGSQNLLGYWDASGGLLPTGTFSSGDTYIISVAGVLTVYDPVTLTQSPQAVNVGDFLQYIAGSPTNPTGWYHVVPSTTVTAGQVQFTPVDNISSTNVQAAIAEVNGDVVMNTSAIAGLTAADANNVKQTGATGAAIIPVGTDLQQPTLPAFGYQRANSEHGWMEWWNGSAWVQLGGMSQVAAEAAFLQVDGGNQMLAPLVFDTNANSVLKVGNTPVAQFPTTCGMPFMKNKLINGEVTRINQRGVANWAAVANGAYGYDRWKKIDASNMTQIIEAGNFRPNTVHTLSGIGVTTQHVTSPASGNWTLPNIPIAATNVQVEEGLEATPFEVRHIGFELGLCQRYYVADSGMQLYGFPVLDGDANRSVSVILPQRLRIIPVVRTQTWSAGTPQVINLTHQSARFNTNGVGVAGIAYLSAYALDAEIP